MDKLSPAPSIARASTNARRHCSSITGHNTYHGNTTRSGDHRRQGIAARSRPTDSAGALVAIEPRAIAGYHKAPGSGDVAGYGSQASQRGGQPVVRLVETLEIHTQPHHRFLELCDSQRSLAARWQRAHPLNLLVEIAPQFLVGDDLLIVWCFHGRCYAR